MGPRAGPFYGGSGTVWEGEALPQEMDSPLWGSRQHSEYKRNEGQPTAGWGRQQRKFSVVAYGHVCLARDSLCTEGVGVSGSSCCHLAGPPAEAAVRGGLRRGSAGMIT